MRVALAQVNSTVGDVRGNLQLLREFYDRACAGIDPSAGGAAGAADIVVFPELVLPGYPPLDLLEQGDFVTALGVALEEFAAYCDRAPALVGTVRPTGRAEGRPLFNTAAFLHRGNVLSFHDKVLLPTYDVFDEDRHFERGGEVRSLPWESPSGKALGVAICEDLWNVPVGAPRRYSRDVVGELLALGVDTILAPSASPYYCGQGEQREYVFWQQSARSGAPILVCNSVGGHTDLIFDGASLWVTPAGVQKRARRFDEDLLFVDVGEDRHSGTAAGEPGLRTLSHDERVSRMADALVLGIRDYFRKCGFAGGVIGLSGGIDSALTAALAVEALGADSVCGIGMPSRFSSEGSVVDARELAQRLGIEFHLIPIEPMFEGSLQALQPLLGDLTGADAGVTPENLQARARGAILMAISNARGSIVLATGNKSELAVGYCTLYGDMCGGLGPIGDVAKTDVYRMAALPRFAAVIPPSTREKPPSAELRPGQLDQDSLPPYEVLDAILALYVDERRSRQEIVEAGFEPSIVQDTLRRVDNNEYKRRQAAPVLRVTSKAFGAGRRLPIACQRNW